MKNLPFLFLFFALSSCFESDITPLVREPSDQLGPRIVVTDVYGKEYPSLDPSKIYCGPGWGAKMCHFLHKHDGTIWTDAENYYSEFSDVKFSNFWGPFFISFFDIDSTASYCEGWKLGEITQNGAKSDITIRIDREDMFWFDYDYYGTSEDIEYTITYKYQVIDGLLHFSSSDGQSFIFHPSERGYTEDSIETDEIIESGGCLFY